MYGLKYGPKLGKPLRIEKNRNGKREAKTRQCSTTERNLLYWSGGPRLQWNPSKCEKKIGKAYGRSHAVSKKKFTQAPRTGAGQETIPSIKPRPKHQLKRATETLINCQMWTTYLQTHILLKASLSCTSLKTTKQSSRWLSKDEVQQWDMFPEPAELSLTGCSTESM